MERLTKYEPCEGGIPLVTVEGEQSALQRLAAYEDAEEHGLLVRFPCKVGDTVYSYSHDKQMRTLKCEGFLFTGICWKARCTDFIPSWVGNQKRHVYIMFSSFGKSAFLTREEAKAALAKDTNVSTKGENNED